MAHLPIWYIGSLTPDICDAAIDDLEKIPSQDAAMGIDGKEINNSYRNTTVRFAGSNHWLEIYLRNLAFHANQECAWKYEVTGNENIQYAEYGPDQHYNWHVDVFPLSGQDFDRKLTAVCLLNDPSEFEGGEFQIKLYAEYVAPLEKGSIIVFPSILEHRVTPVTKGIRKTATIWFHGPRFR